MQSPIKGRRVVSNHNTSLNTPKQEYLSDFYDSPVVKQWTKSMS